MTQELVVCKLIFGHGSITAEGVHNLLKKYTSDFSIANFCELSQIGANKITFAVVDLPREVVPQLIKAGVIQDADMMSEGGLHYASKEKKCGKGGGCGCG